MYNELDVRKAYELAVGLQINYNYHISNKWTDYFDKIAKMLNTNSVPLAPFMKAMFEHTWVVKGKRGFRQLKYPYPNHIAGPKALKIYKEYSAKYAGLPTAADSLEQEVTSSAVVVERLKPSLAELYTLYEEGRISIYYLALRQDFYKWVMGRDLYNKLDSKFVAIYKNSYLFLMGLDIALFYRLAAIVGR